MGKYQINVRPQQYSIIISTLPGERDLTTMKTKNQNSKQTLLDFTVKNKKKNEDIEKKIKDIEKKRQDYHMLFKVALENIIGRLKDYEADCDKKGIVLPAKYAHLEKIADEEQRKILDFNEKIVEVNRTIKGLQSQYKEFVKTEEQDEELIVQRNLYRQKYEEAKSRSREYQMSIEDFKKRFIQQNKQIYTNKQRQKQLQNESDRITADKNYLEKENQEHSKTTENLQLIRGNLLEEVAQFRKEVAEMQEKKRISEDFIMSHL